MKNIIPTLMLLSFASVASGAVTLSNIPNMPDGPEDVLSTTSSTSEIAIVTQTFTVGDAQSGASLYDFVSISFNVNFSDTLGNHTATAALSGLGVPLALTEVIGLGAGTDAETVTFPSAPSLQLTPGETYTLTLTLSKDDDRPSSEVIVIYTEDNTDTTTSDSGETISGPWGIGNNSSNTGGNFASGTIPLEMSVELTAVPEPSSALLMGFAGMCLVARRRR